MIPISRALKIVEKRVKRISTEKVQLSESVGRVLAEDIFADTDLPPFDRAQMDGFAVRTKDLETIPRKLKIIGESVAGKGFDGKITEGETVRIMTGARLPKGADAVQKKELVSESKEAAGFAEILEAAKFEQHLVRRAAEIKKGKRVLEKSQIVSPQMVAVLASFGYSKVTVFRKPRVSILATGSEIVSVSETPRQDQIRDSNSASLRAFAEGAGAVATVLPGVKDDLKSLKGIIEKAARKSDLLILSGGVSVGDYDFTKPALRELGAEIFFERVALRPGKPTVFAKLNDCFVFGLPGNPVSVAVTFFLFARKAIRQMQGAAGGDCDLREGPAVLTKNVKGSKGRDSYIPAKMDFNEKGQMLVEPIKWGGSSDFAAFSKADCLIYIPKDESAAASEIVRILFLPS